jgi:two-component system nitrate/nitrite response regulator NarL
MTASILLAERHKLLRNSLRSLIEALRPEIEIHDAGSTEQLHESLRYQSDLDLLLIDRNMFECDDDTAIDSLRARAPRIKMVILADRASHGLSQGAISPGADGLVHLDLSGRVIMRALDSVLSGKHYIPALGMGLLPAANNAPSYVSPAQPSTRGPFQNLTPRARDVLNFLVKGHSNRGITDRLSVKDITVSLHLKGLFRKLDALNQTQAATNALRLGRAA